MNGAYGERRYGFSSTVRTANVASASPAASPDAAASSSTTTSLVPRRRPSSPKSRPVATRRPSTATRSADKERGSVGSPERPVSKVPSMSQ